MGNNKIVLNCFFGGLHTWWCSGLTSGFVLSDHTLRTWWSKRGPVDWTWIVNINTLLYYLSLWPLNFKFFLHFCLFWGLTQKYLAQCLLLALHSGIALDGAQGTIWGAKYWIQVGCMQGKYLTCYSISPAIKTLKNDHLGFIRCLRHKWTLGVRHLYGR